MAPKVIHLLGPVVKKEVTAAGAITPGHLLALTNSVVHGTATANANGAFALENVNVGKGIADAYVSGETVQYGVFARGAEVYAILAASQTIAIGDPLESAGDGTLQALTANAATSQALRQSIVGYAVEAVTTTTATARISVEVA